MRFSKYLLPAALLVCAPTLHADFLGFSTPELEVITTSELTDAGKLIPTPSTANPVYFRAIDLGFKDLGGIIAGDKVPTSKQMNAMILKILAKQGYLPANAQHPATQMLTWYWGTLYVNRLSFNPDMPSQQVNERQMLRFLGGEKLGIASASASPSFSEYDSPVGLQITSPDQARFLEAAKNDLYVIAIGSYEFQSTLEGKPTRLWTTKIAAPSRGLVLADTLPSMLTIAAPNIGRDTPKPVWIHADDRFKADILIGPATVAPESK